ncbi:MAG TPA: SdrD B-like domain-containing protein, partial [Mycobacterium sp.]|nr:SdrD B-like domain-containing protein [Mycobacterium sp.]
VDAGTIARSLFVVFSDDDNDGVRDAGETGISGVRLTLSGTDVDGNAVSRSATTSADGSYRFVDLVASDSSGYTVTEAQPAGWTDGTDATGSAADQNGDAAPDSGADAPTRTPRPGARPKKRKR